MANNDLSTRRYALPPCMAGEVAPDYFDPLAVDPELACDVARWRRAERGRLSAERQAMTVEGRRAAGDALAGHLRDLLAARFGLAPLPCGLADPENWIPVPFPPPPPFTE